MFDSQRVLATLRSLIYAGGFVGLWTWVGYSVRPFDAHLPFTVSPALRPVGFVLGVIGGLVVTWCVGVFVVRGRGTPAPFDAPRRFVVTGPYRYVRNPMYIGAMTIIAAAGLILRAPSLVVLAGFFWLCTHLFVLRYEEPTLTHQFGDAYRRYKATVRRWLPRWRVRAQ